MDASAGISVVIPMGPGDSPHPVLLDQLTKFPFVSEIILSGCEESQRALCEPLLTSGNIKFHISTPGRAGQQNAAAAQAKQDWLWFVHTDSDLTHINESKLSQFLGRGGNSIGYFNLYFTPGGFGLMVLNTIGVWIRSHLFHMPFGDQGLVIRRVVFDSLGQFKSVPSFGEDHELIWRAKRAGIQIKAIGGWLGTSPRKYQEKGWLAVTGRHLWLTYRFAVPQAWQLLLRKKEGTRSR